MSNLAQGCSWTWSDWSAMLKINSLSDKALLEWFLSRPLKKSILAKWPYTPWKIYYMRNYVCFSHGTCYHCNTLKQHFLSWETLIDPHHCSGWINIKMTSRCIFCSSRSFTTHSPKSPYICPASLLLPLSVSLALHLSHTHSPACMCAIYQTLLPSLCPCLLLLLCYLGLWKHGCQKLVGDRRGLVSVPTALAQSRVLCEDQAGLFLPGQR